MRVLKRGWDILQKKTENLVKSLQLDPAIDIDGDSPRAPLPWENLAGASGVFHWKSQVFGSVVIFLKIFSIM